MVRRLCLAAVALYCCIACQGNTTVGDPATSTPVEAIWSVQELDFHFQATHAYYTCGGLTDKIQRILLAVGARPNLSVRMHCPASPLITSAHVRIVLTTPVRATAENVRKATTFDSRERLAARLLKVRLPTAADLEHFPAEWRDVAFSRGDLVRLEPGDCELMTQLREQVFTKLALRMSERPPRCATTGTRILPDYRVVALMPARRTSVASAP
ncbi:MAG: hypothetical protein DIU71_11925 [Proteobacteria bacterium]|nr:MAG: hypothetical protein DIU71_11925 [Pseudomonadota bacterium]